MQRSCAALWGKLVKPAALSSQAGRLAISATSFSTSAARATACFTMNAAALQTRIVLFPRQSARPAEGARFLTEQVSLNNIHDNPGAKKAKRRIGRGIGSGRGKTATKGHKGQKARAGNKGLLGFEGGQNPVTRAFPKRGFVNIHGYLTHLSPLNLGKLMQWIKAGRLDPSQMITMKNLRDTGCVPQGVKKGVKLLSKGMDKVDRPIQIEVSDASAKAKEAISKAGGHVKIAYYNRLGFRALLRPEKFTIIPRRAAPPPKLMWKYPEHYKDVKAQLEGRL